MREVEETNGNAHSAARLTFRIVPDLLKIIGLVFEKHCHRMLYDIVALVDRSLLVSVGPRCILRTSSCISMNLLPWQRKPFRDEKARSSCQRH